MLSLLIGILAATGASTLYSLGIGVQAIDARATSQRHTLRISLLGQLLRRGRWLAGTAMTALGWPLQIVALLFAPLEVVQPALAIGLLVLLALGERMLGERPGRLLSARSSQGSSESRRWRRIARRTTSTGSRSYWCWRCSELRRWCRSLPNLSAGRSPT
jgi:hypothetical protein